MAERISIVIPTLDEARRIGLRLEELSRMPGIDEVIVVDGGSQDATLAIARAFPGVLVLAAPRGRASQMNAGARAAEGDVLLFLRADVSLPPNAAELIARAFDDPAAVAGAFRTWTVPDGDGLHLGPLLRLADLRSRYTCLPCGDQAIFVRRWAFERAGGYSEQELMEDLELSRRLTRIGRIAIVPTSACVSGRRFIARTVRSAIAMNVSPFLYDLGVPPRILARLYGVCADG